jgi:hypothetical protein
MSTTESVLGNTGCEDDDGGFVGGAQYNGAVHDFVSLLKLGELLHVGKASGFGLGKFKIETSPGRVYTGFQK